MNITMIGNCQIQSMMGLYRRFARHSIGKSIHYIRSYELISEADTAAIQSADLIIEQIQDFRPAAGIGDIVTKAERIGVPVVNCGFLWPFAGQPHPNNQRRPFRDGGPYGSEASDAFLNRLIKKGVCSSDALTAYTALDVNATVNLDRLMEVSMERQRARDSLTNFQIAPIIEAHFRDEQIFLTPYHPNVRVAVALASQLFGKIGVDEADIGRMKRAIRISPFPKEELPLHPAVARHFGLSWATADRSYRLVHEGRFTFAEFVERYVNCAWNERLDEGIEAWRNGRADHAYTLLIEALPDAPRSAIGHSSLAHALDRLGRRDEALPYARRAVELEPEEASFRLALGLLLYQRGEDQSGERELRLAVALDPFNPHYFAMLCNRLRNGDAEEAAAVARHGLVCSPYDARLHMELGQARSILGDVEGALESFGAALSFDASQTGCYIHRADLLERTGRRDAAASALREGIKRRPRDVALRQRLATLLDAAGAPEAEAAWQEVIERAGDQPDILGRAIQAMLNAGRLAQADDVVRAAIAQHPAAASLRRDLSQVLERTGRLEEAAAVMRQACSLAPDDAAYSIRLGDLCLRLGCVEEAEGAYRRATACAPANAHAHGQLGHALGLLCRFDEAIEERQIALRLDPANMHRRAQLGHSYLAAGRLDDAARELRAAIAGAGGTAAFHSDLSHVLFRNGRVEEAIASIRHAIVLAPAFGRYRGMLGQYLEHVGALQEADAAYGGAVSAGVADAQTYVQYSRLLARTGRREVARQMAEAALGIDPRHETARMQLRSLEAVAQAG